jgi:PAT family beta-lactamase induction signal transducer AmpG
MGARLLKLPPGIYIPTLYFIEGLPYTMVTMMSIVWFKNFGVSNAYVGVVTTLLSLPWTLKLFWAPLVDTYSTRRRWILVLHVVLGILSAVLAAVSLIPHSAVDIITVFAVMAFASATQDVAIDGYYMDVLAKEQQALYVGFRNAAYKIAWLIGSGAMIYMVGAISEHHGIPSGWSASFSLCAVLFFAAAAFHSAVLPHPEEPHVHIEASSSQSHALVQQFGNVFKTFFSQDHALIISLYILTFRLGDALMMKMTQPFLLDPPNVGGLGISTEQLGMIYGTVGTIFLLIGGITGSIIVARFSLRKVLMPAAIIQSAAILLYWGLAVLKPSLPMVACVNAAEQFSYGLGTAAYTVYLMSTVKPEYKASHYAIATGMMALGLLVPGLVSGYLTNLGYPTFFLISFFASIPGIITIAFLPFKDDSPPQR